MSLEVQLLRCFVVVSFWGCWLTRLPCSLVCHVTLVVSFVWPLDFPDRHLVDYDGLWCYETPSTMNRAV